MTLEYSLSFLQEHASARYDFWYDARNRIERALIDLQLFVEVAGDSNISQGITAESLKPVVAVLLRSSYEYSGAKPDLKIAEIARLCINAGFVYLQSKMSSHITLSHKDAIDRALDLADYLA